MGFSPADSEVLLSLAKGLSVANLELVRILFVWNSKSFI